MLRKLSVIYKKERHWIRNNYYQPKTLENPNIVDIKSVIMEHRKMSHNLSRTKRQAEKVFQVGVYIVLQKE